MGTLLDEFEKRDALERYGMNIKFNLPRTSLWNFRIAYRNKFSKTNEQGIAIAVKGVELYSSAIAQQISDSGYYLEKLEERWTEDCYNVYLRPKDANIEFPRMKVYVHPNEMAGWAPRKKDIEKLLEIAKNNLYLSNVHLAYCQKVYNLDNEQYLKILHDAEEEILAWLLEYKKHHRRSVAGASEAFNRIFGIKRLAVRHLSYHDYVVINYINQLIAKL